MIFNQYLKEKLLPLRDRSPGLVVMGDNSCSKGRVFESWRPILDGHFSHCFVVKILLLFENTNNKQKRAGVGPFFTTYAYMRLYLSIGY